MLKQIYGYFKLFDKRFWWKMLFLNLFSPFLASLHYTFMNGSIGEFIAISLLIPVSMLIGMFILWVGEIRPMYKEIKKEVEMEQKYPHLYDRFQQQK